MNPLDKVIELRSQIIENQKAILHFLVENPEKFPPDYYLNGKSTGEVDNILNEIVKHLDELTIVSLWAVFEQQVIDNLILRYKMVISGSSDRLAIPIREYFERRTERIKIEDILGIYKNIVDKETIAYTGKVKDYRDWIAHGKPKRRVPQEIDPLDAKHVFDDFFLKSGMI
jgi:hypothetical protein